jgi:hypothetical protein
MNMFNLMLSLIFLNSIGVIYTMQIITLPSAAKINARLNTLELQDFVKKTELDTQLAGKELNAFGVARAVSFAIHDYHEIAHNSAVSQVLWRLMPEIIKAILFDYPEQVEEFYDFGFLVRSLSNADIYNSSQK